MLSTNKELSVDKPLHTNTEELFKLTLQELAAEGNQKAQLALSLGRQLEMKQQLNRLSAEVIRDAVGKEVRAANNNLLEALRENDYKWTGATDKFINKAQNNLMGIMTILTQ